jgi:hypothetical protein
MESTIFNHSSSGTAYASRKYGKEFDPCDGERSIPTDEDIRTYFME